MKHFYIKLKNLIFHLLHYISTAVWRENNFFISLSSCLLLFVFILKNWWRCFGSLPCLIPLKKNMTYHFHGNRVRKMTSIPERLSSPALLYLMLQGLIVVESWYWWQWQEWQHFLSLAGGSTKLSCLKAMDTAYWDLWKMCG